MNDLLSLTSAQLNHAADIKEKISALEEELASFVGSPATSAPAPKKKSKISAAGRGRIAAAQKARWAKVKGTKPAKKRKMSAAGRAAIAASAKARWAKAKAAGKTSL
jgi:anti-sigma-K factor RskA